MLAKLTLYPPDRPSQVRLVREHETLVIGRDPEAHLVLDDARVSRRHARIDWNGGCRLEDLRSKNGTLVNGLATTETALKDRDWISFGGIVARFEIISEEQAERLREERNVRLRTSVDMRECLRPDLEPADLLRSLLASAMQLTGSERGLVLLVSAGGRLCAEVASGFLPADLAGDRFAGSVSAIDRALKAGSSVVVSDAQTDAFFAARPSVVENSISTLACVPLRHDSGILGLMYVDGRKPLDGFTDLDLEILEALAEHAALVLMTAQLRGDVRRLLRALPGQATLADRGWLDKWRQQVGALGEGPRPIERMHRVDSLRALG